MCCKGTKRIWIMDRASHNPSGSATRTTTVARNTGGAKPPANQPSHFAMTSDGATSRISSAGQGREERDPQNSRSSRACSDSAAAVLVHELANTTTAVLMNAQVLGWKLPPYSHLKRPLREIERNAQRGSELMKCLLRRLETDGTGQAERQRVQDGGLGLTARVAGQEPRVEAGSAENLPPPQRNSRPAPVSLSAPEVELTSPVSFPTAEVELTTSCDACTSTFPKKG
jgi:hypothetical protein